MAKAKKVKAEVFEKAEPHHSTLKTNAIGFLAKLRIGVAIVLDAIDFVLANIPIINTLWDFVTFAILLLILKNKWLAVAAFGELPLVGLPILGQIDAFIPMATIITLIDAAESKFHFIHMHEMKK
jgi:hypothetical protein